MKNKLKLVLDNKVMILLLILLLGFVLRVINLKDNFIFAYDQGRDAYRIFNILRHGNFKIVGPETDVPGVFNGALYYYFLLPFYWISNFDPNLVAMFFVLANLLGIVLVYFLAEVIFNEKLVGFLAGLLYAFSYSQLVYSRYISNASLMSISTTTFFLGLALVIFKKKDSGLLISAIFYALAIHFNFYLIYLGLFYPLIYIIYKPVISKKAALFSTFFFSFLISPFVIAEVKWHFSASRSLLHYFLTQSRERLNLYARVIRMFSSYFNKIREGFYYSFLAINSKWLLIGLFVFTLVLFELSWEKSEKSLKRRIFIYLWVFSTFPLFFFKTGVITVPVINTTILNVWILLVAYVLYVFIMHKNILLRIVGITLFVLMILSQLELGYQDNFIYKSMLVKNPLLYRDEKNVINYTYQSFPKHKFSICALTNPLFINVLWSFLYETYGYNQYRYLPYWAGQKQYFIATSLPYDKNHVANRILILEPLIGIPQHALRATIYMENKVSDLIEEKKIGNITVQKRRLNLGKKSLLNKRLEDLIKIDPRYSCFNNY